MLLYLLALWVGWSREEVRSTLLNSHGVGHAELVMVLGQPGFCAGGNWRGKQEFGQVERCRSGCPGEAAELSLESAAFPLGSESEIQGIWKAQMEGRRRAGQWCSCCGHRAEVP